MRSLIEHRDGVHVHSLPCPALSSVRMSMAMSVPVLLDIPQPAVLADGRFGCIQVDELHGVAKRRAHTCMDQRGMAWHGMAWHGVAWRGGGERISGTDQQCSSNRSMPTARQRPMFQASVQHGVETKSASAQRAFLQELGLSKGKGYG